MPTAEEVPDLSSEGLPNAQDGLRDRQPKVIEGARSGSDDAYRCRGSDGAGSVDDQFRPSGLLRTAM